jgi:hypothetical protein
LINERLTYEPGQLSDLLITAVASLVIAEVRDVPKISKLLCNNNNNNSPFEGRHRRSSDLLTGTDRLSRAIMKSQRSTCVV